MGGAGDEDAGTHGFPAIFSLVRWDGDRGDCGFVTGWAQGERAGLGAEEEWGEVEEVLAPDDEGVGAGDFDFGDGESFLFGPGGEGAVGGDEVVVGAAADPEEVEFGFGGVDGKAGVVALGAEGGAHADDPGEEVRVLEADGDAFEAAHGEAGDGTVLTAPGDVVSAVDLGDDFFGEHASEEVDVLAVHGDAAVAAFEDDVEVAVAAGHDDDGGDHFVVGDEAIEHEVGFAGEGPAVFGVGEAVEEVEDGIAGFAVGVVVGRGVDDVGGLVTGVMEADVGAVGVGGDVAVGDVGEFPGGGGGCGKEDVAVEVEEVGVCGGIEGVEDLDAVDGEGVAVELRWEGGGGGGPDAAGVFGEGEGREEGVGGDGDLMRGGSGEAEGDGVVGVGGGVRCVLECADGHLGGSGERSEGDCESEKEGRRLHRNMLYRDTFDRLGEGAEGVGESGRRESFSLNGCLEWCLG